MAARGAWGVRALGRRAEGVNGHRDRRRPSRRCRRRPKSPPIGRQSDREPAPGRPLDCRCRLAGSCFQRSHSSGKGLAQREACPLTPDRWNDRTAPRSRPARSRCAQSRAARDTRPEVPPTCIRPTTRQTRARRANRPLHLLQTRRTGTTRPGYTTQLAAGAPWRDSRCRHVGRARPGPGTSPKREPGPQRARLRPVGDHRRTRRRLPNIDTDIYRPGDTPASR